jgi:hypothetical protein
VTDSDRIPGTGRQSDPLAAFPRAPVQGGGDSRDELADVVLERIKGRLGDDREPAPEAPSVEQAITLRDQAPELYDLWLKIAQEKASTANYVDRAPYEVPERLAQSGRPRALGALIVVLSFCGYLAWLGGPGPYIGGLIAILDLVAMLGVFFGLRPDRLAEPRRPSHKPLARRSRAPLPGGHTHRAPIVIMSSCLYGGIAETL